MASASVWRVVEYLGITSSTRWAGTDPVSVGGGKAEVTACVITLEAAVDDIVDAPVSTGVGDLEVSLAGVYSGGRIGDDEVLDKCKQDFGASMSEFTYHTASVGGRVPIYHGAPDVKVLASTTVGICPATVALLSTRVHVIPIEEHETHVLLKS